MGAGGNGSAAGLQALRQVLDEQKLALPSLVASVTEPLTERVRAMEMLLQSRGSDQASAERLARVEQTLATTAQSIASAGAATVDMAERVKRLEVQLAQRAGAESQQAQLFAQGVQTLSAKMTQVEGLVQSHGDRSVKYAQQLAQQAAETQQRELTQLHEQLVTLGGNQKTLAESLDQWRADSEGGLSIVANRIDQIEKVVTAPMGLLKQVQSDLQNLQQVTLADYDQNRKGIRNWLFGTDDIFATTWRDETRQIRDRLKQLREERRA
jgi:phage-related tail protein